MKKVLLIIALFMVSITLKAVEPTVKFYLEDGNSKEYRMADLIEMSFVESDVAYIMKICSFGYTSSFNTKDIYLIELIDIYTLKVNLSSEVRNYDIRTIDSITFVPKPLNQTTVYSVTWMNKNLDVEYYRNGDPIPQVTDSAEWQNLTTGAWCYYNNDPAMGAIYGKLYNGFAVTDPRGLAPVGWEIPFYSVWTSLQMRLYKDGNFGGGRLKTTGTVEKGDGLWASPNTGATNEFEFSAIPGGFRSETGAFAEKGKTAKYWSSTEVQLGYLWWGGLSYESDKLDALSGSLKCGYSVRCILSSAPVVKPIIDSLSTISAAIGESITIYGSSFGKEQKKSSVRFSSVNAEESDYISWSDTEIKVKVPFGATSGIIAVTVNNEKSNLVFFTVSGTESDVYTAVQIGDAAWMSRNLSVDHYRNGDPIPQVTDQTEWNNLKTGAWCYSGNDPSNGAIYGKLYNWYALHDSRGLAPEGWHLASDTDWTLLIAILGGGNAAGGKLKTTGTTKDPGGLWKAPNMGATNESGFSAIPGGDRSDYGFGLAGSSASWWTTTEADADKAWYRMIFNSEVFCLRSSRAKNVGYSVRCIKE